MRIIISGSRSFNDRKLLFDTMDRLAAKLKRIVVLSGHAEGADRLGEEWANARWHMWEVHRPDWAKHGKAAGPIRNAEMAKAADCLVCFWDGNSLGTKSMIDEARSRGLKIRIIKYKEKKDGKG